MIFTILVTLISSRTIIVPKTLKTHRLTLNSKDGTPILINSAINNDTLKKDKFKIPVDYTFISDNDHSVCYKKGEDGLTACKNEGRRQPWRILDETRHVRFTNVEHKCLTVGEKMEDDKYSVVLKTCDAANEDQVFIVNKEHGKTRDKAHFIEMRKQATTLQDGTNILGEDYKKVLGKRNYDDGKTLENEATAFVNRDKHRGNPASDKNVPQKVVIGNGTSHLSI